MSLTMINHIDYALAETITTQAAERAEAARLAKEAAQAQSTDFASVLNNAANSYSSSQNTSSSVSCPVDLESIFTEAANTYNVSGQLLKCIAKTESNFNTNAVSSKGAVGIMQLMPQTAASLGVTNSYDARENIMGGANLISQLLTKYQGNISLALAAYNAGSGSVDTYGGIPPYAETQNYVQKVLSYMGTDITIPTSYNTGSSVADNNTSAADHNTSADNSASTEPASAAAAPAAEEQTSVRSGKITVTVVNGNVLDKLQPKPDPTETATDQQEKTDPAYLSPLSELTGEDREKVSAALEAFLASKNISLEKLQNLIQTMEPEQQV